MEFVYVAVAVLSLLSVGQSAPVTTCESLVQPLEIQGRDQLLGKWKLLAESTDVAGASIMTKVLVDTTWVQIAPSNESNAMMHYEAAKMFGKCFTVRTKMTLEKSTILTTNPFNASAILLNTGCPDCLVVRSTYFIRGDKYAGLQLLSRRDKVSDAEKDEFLQQVKCLNLPSPTILDSEKGFCPDDSFTNESNATDLTDHVNIAFKALDLFQTLTGENGLIDLLTQLFDATDA